MKKSLIVLLSVMVVLAFAASAFALHQVKTVEYQPSVVKAGKSQITLGGEIRIRGNHSNNLDADNKADDKSQSYDQRVRISTKANVTDKTWGVVELETGANSSVGGNGNYTWGTPVGSKRDSKRDSLYLRQAYIAHQFGMIGGIKAGHMLLGLGNRLFFDHTNYGDDAILAWLAVGPGELSLIDIKLAERNTASINAHRADQLDDWEAYVAALEMPLGAVNVGADVTYLMDHDKSTYTRGERFTNVGVRADADLKVVKIKGDVEYQDGTSRVRNVSGGGAPKKFKYKGYAAMLGVEANAGPATVRGGAAIGSGNKNDSSFDKKNEGFRTFLTDSQYSTFVYDYSVKGASGDTNQGLTNTKYVTVGASVKPTADLKISTDVYYLRAVEKVALNGATRDINNVCAATAINSSSCVKSRELGWEVDGKVEYQLASNLAYYIEAGYLFAGDAYDTKDSSGKTNDADNPYRVRHGLLLQF